MFLKDKTVLPTILFLGVVILVVLAFSSHSYMPYSDEDLFHEYSVYEGMINGTNTENFEEEFDEGLEDEGFEERFEEGAEDITTQSEDKKDKAAPKAESSATPSEEKKATTETFENMYDTGKLGYAPLNMQENIDRFGDIVHVPTSGKCISAGLYTSHGPLCLTPELRKLLETRGDNM